MRIAWFREHQIGDADAFDETVVPLAELGHTHEIEIFTPSIAHEFVWRHFRARYDLCIYELRSPEHRSFAYGYARHVPGIALTRGQLPLGVEGQRSKGKGQRGTEGPVRFGLVSPARAGMAERAAHRARDLGAAVDLTLGEPSALIPEVDVVLALAWPAGNESLLPAVMGMAAAKPVVVFEVDGTAGWPALDPQTWRPRDPLPTGDPIVVSIDARDDEHSLMLAIRRLSADAGLREALGTAAHAWWATHATPAHALATWQRLIDDALSNPANIDGARRDGSEHARATLADFGARVDFLR